MDSNMEFYRNKELVAKRKKEQELRYKEQSKQNLRKSVSIKIRTTMIGALSVFEDYFGYLWGHEQETPLNPNQLKFRQMWEDARAEILDKGNSNLRGAEEEISNYECEWKRYHNEFVIKNQDIRSNNNGRGI
jgi:hypothetical protein